MFRKFKSLDLQNYLTKLQEKHSSAHELSKRKLQLFFTKPYSQYDWYFTP